MNSNKIKTLEDKVDKIQNILVKIQMHLDEPSSFDYKSFLHKELRSANLQLELLFLGLVGLRQNY